MAIKRRPDQKIEGLNGITICDFWSWAYSDILNNRNRSIFAEFIVANSLDLINNPRVEWDGTDLRYKNFKIEIKCAAYVQSWNQKKLSTIRYDISKKRCWDALIDEYYEIPVRFSDCYVFCLYNETNLDNRNILNVDKWDFYVVSTKDINTRFENQKSVSLSRLQEVYNKVDYNNLKKKVDKVLVG
ncbi:hypothetical protein [Methanohalophilus sp.]